MSSAYIKVCKGGLSFKAYLIESGNLRDNNVVSKAKVS